MSQILVAQLGARRHYAVPAAFHVAGKLEMFYTDVYLSSEVLRGSVAIAAKLGNWPSVSRLKGRSITGLPDNRVCSFPSLALRSRIRRYGFGSEKYPTENWLWLGENFCTRVATRLRSRPRSVYAFTSAARELFQRNKLLGGKNILDQATAPRKTEMELVRKEMERFSDWVECRQPDAYLNAYHERQVEEFELADLVLCASTFAKLAIVAEGVQPNRIRVVPLGLDAKLENRHKVDKRSKGHLRVLFVGDDGLRKGIGYLDQAIRKLASAQILMRVIGNLGVNGRGTAQLGRRMELLGSVPRDLVGDHFRWANVLVLPSVSDTFGLVILEALASGLPVVASTNTCAPDVVRDGVDGFVVPIRDSDAIADRLDRLASSPELLAEMSRNARERAREFSLEKYSERLLNAIGHEL